MKVFLGGTCNGSKWRDVLIPMLTCEFFNPVVEAWTTECQAEEIRQRWGCDFVMYTITPKMTGVYSVAEVVDDSNKRPEKTIMVLLQKDDDAVLSQHQWKSLQATAQMVAENGGRVFYSLRDCAEWLNSRG